MKVIFLDVDGVLNSVDDLMEYREKNNIKGSILYDDIADKRVLLLKELVEKSKAEIVISSSWRMGWLRNGKPKELNPNGLLYKLQTKLKEFNLNFIDVTPSLWDKDIRYTRGDEIRTWLENHPEVTNFVILDDEDDMCEFTKSNLVQTTYEHGLLQEHVDKAFKILNKEE
jgi:hypothetical protein